MWHTKFNNWSICDHINRRTSLLCANIFQLQSSSNYVSRRCRFYLKIFQHDIIFLGFFACRKHELNFLWTVFVIDSSRIFTFSFKDNNKITEIGATFALAETALECDFNIHSRKVVLLCCDVFNQNLLTKLRTIN